MSWFDSIWWFCDDFWIRIACGRRRPEVEVEPAREEEVVVVATPVEGTPSLKQRRRYTHCTLGRTLDRTLMQ